METTERTIQFAQSVEALSDQYGVQLVAKPFGRTTRLYVVDLETEHTEPLDLLQNEGE